MRNAAKNIIHMYPRKPPEEIHVHIVLDEAITRMCKKYDVKPRDYMLKCLVAHLHDLSIDQEQHKAHLTMIGQGSLL